MGADGRDIRRSSGSRPGGNGVYGLGMIGAWVYYWRTADTTADRALGVLKGLAWPALLVYEAFSALDSRGRPR